MKIINLRALAGLAVSIFLGGVSHGGAVESWQQSVNDREKTVLNPHESAPPAVTKFY